MASDIAQNWAAIVEWVKQNAPRIASDLQHRGATNAEIDAVEKRLGVQFPDALRDLYRLCAGGEGSDLFPSLEEEDMGFGLIPIEDITSCWGGEEDYGVGPEDVTTEPGIRAAYWDKSWIPFADNGGGDYFCVDMNPAEGGTAGQVIYWGHEELTRQMVAPSLTALVQQLAQGLASGKYTYDEDSGIVWIE